MNPILLVTGGSRGIGAATARLAATRGWDVAVNYTRDAAAAEAVAADVRAAGRRAWVLQADVADDTQVVAMFQALDREAGALSGLVNNAGVVDVAARVDEMSAARVQRMFAINVFGTLSCSREALRRMSTRYGGGGGVIVNLSSAAAQVPPPACRVLMRRTASREQVKVPKTLMANMRCQRAMSISSTRAATSTTPALLTSPDSTPASWSSCSNIASTWASSATLACSSTAKKSWKIKLAPSSYSMRIRAAYWPWQGPIRSG